VIKAEDRMDIITEELKGKKVLVVGLARSGTGAANLLSSYDADVTVTDTRPQNLLQDNIDSLLPSIDTITGENPEEAFTSASLIVVSPGVPLDMPSIVSAKNKGVPVIGELELAYQTVINSMAEMAPLFIGITGTNGKSTTTTMVDLMLSESGYNTLLGGNIGNALTEEILKLTDEGGNLADIDFVVAEISSFQLESIDLFRPAVAIILNITPDHLDRYDTLKDYVEAKVRIFENQREGDCLVLNADDPEIKGVKSEGVKTMYFSRSKKVNGIYCEGNSIYCNFSLPSLPVAPFELIKADEVMAQGAHNLENAMAASIPALIAGCSLEAVREVLRSFPGLEHRNELVRTVNGISFVNDSKGTNVGAVAKSLESYNDVILIMGGMAKGSDFSSLKDLVKEKVRLLILLGEAKEKIAEEIGAVTNIEYADDMKSAVDLSASRASNGDVVLLSPGCASFDMFEDFEDRGRRFKENVNAL
jgi:UDP-N-acetylmuramoylalanine--D-glutamate ligase